jgi:hypothetical protein
LHDPSAAPGSIDFPAIGMSLWTSIQSISSQIDNWIKEHRLVALSYYRINKLLWRWRKEDGARIVGGVWLSLDAPAPTREILKPPPAAPSRKPKAQAGDGLLKMMELRSRFKTWLETPNPPKPVKQEETVPPFDIQEIPAAMRKTYLTKSAALMERWFEGRLNYSPTGTAETEEINQDGKPYPRDMYDTTTIKLDWILQFPRAKAKYDYLVKEAIRAPKAIKALHDIVARYQDQVTDIFASDICKKDPISLHRHFQFQRAGVDGTFGQKINLLLTDNLERGGAPDDLTGALGSFNFYAAIGHARLSRDVNSRKTTAEVTGIWVYVKDNYTFTDNEQDDRSQYLGHWSRDGVIVMPLDAAAAISSYIPYIETPITLPYIDASVTIGNPVIKGNVYYPVHNSDFRQWAIKHQQGGDFVVFSDRRFVPVAPPVKVYL